jgi:hypothetical protein
METIFDWVTMIVFAGLITLFLQRSSMDNPPDTIWHYLPPAAGCALANYLGNEGLVIPAVAVLIAVGAYLIRILGVRMPGT